MPIKPKNAVLYPADWKAIRQEVLERAGHECEQCGARNHATGQRDENGKFYELRGGKLKIVLTIAHLNHDPTDCGEPGDRPNLRAWCQRCHLAHDKAHHLASSWHTRRAKKRTAELF